MSAKLTLTIDQKVISKAKKYAHEHGRSLSNLVEDYLLSPVEEGAIRVGDKEVNYKKILEDELLKKYLD